MESQSIGTGTQVLQYCLTGITTGSIYALVALGFNMIYNVTEIINFAQGEFVVLGGLMMVTLSVSLGLPFWASFPLALVFVAAVGFLLDRLAIRPIKSPSVITMIIATIAASILIKGTAMFAWGKNSHDLPAFSGRQPIELGGVVLQPQSLWVVGALIAVVIALTLFYERTILGKAMKACADNAAAASLVGINVGRMVLLSFAISGAVGALAGIVVTPISLMDYDRGAMLGLKGFSAVILGGLGSFQGAVLGGLLIGLLESLGAGLVSSAYKDAFALLLLLALLVVKPSGLLGNTQVKKL
jgi:branched-chain amino acid transport system permease protein